MDLPISSRGNPEGFTLTRMKPKEKKETVEIQTLVARFCIKFRLLQPQAPNLQRLFFFFVIFYLNWA